MMEQSAFRAANHARSHLAFLAAGLACAAAACETGAPAPAAPAGEAAPAPSEAPAAASFAAAEMTVTMYDDGLACPAGCDAHVVFHPAHNGTANAFAPPVENRAALQPCRNGEACVICFSSAAESCMLARYRGAGPPRGRFDFTPAFFESRCGEENLPATFGEACRSVERAIASFGYDVRVNCLKAQTDDARCAPLIRAARQAQQRDAVERARCLSLGGDAAYNAQQPDPSLHRTLDCNYFLNQRGENAAGATWFKLTPGACRPDTFVGRDCLDCCSASVYAAAKLHPECRAFFLEPQGE